MKKNYNNKEEEPKGLRVTVYNNDMARALRKFKKKVQDDGILQELREREFFEKHSIKRKKAKAAARSRWLKQLSRNKEQ